MAKLKDSRKPAFLWADNRLVDDFGPIIGAVGMGVYVCLARHANQQRQSFPSYATISLETKLSRRQVIRVMRLLVDCGLIKVTTRPRDDGPHRTNIYHLMDIPTPDLFNCAAAGGRVTSGEGDMSPYGDIEGGAAEGDMSPYGDIQSPFLIEDEQEPLNKNHEQEKGASPLEPPLAAKPPGEGITKRRRTSETLSIPSDSHKPSDTARDTPDNQPDATKATRSRPRDLLFDAVAEVTASDPKASGSHIGRVCKLLKLAEPPYSPDEVRGLPDILAARGFSLPISLGTLEKYIGWVRQTQIPASPPPWKKGNGGESMKFDGLKRWAAMHGVDADHPNGRPPVGKGVQ